MFPSRQREPRPSACPGCTLRAPAAFSLGPELLTQLNAWDPQQAICLSLTGEAICHLVCGELSLQALGRCCWVEKAWSLNVPFVYHEIKSTLLKSKISTLPNSQVSGVQLACSSGGILQLWGLGALREAQPSSVDCFPSATGASFHGPQWR